MKSHFHIESKNPQTLAKKVMRGGTKTLSDGELLIVAEELRTVASYCSPERAQELYKHFDRECPPNLNHTPASGEKDALYAKLKGDMDKAKGDSI